MPDFALPAQQDQLLNLPGMTPDLLSQLRAIGAAGGNAGVIGGGGGFLSNLFSGFGGSSTPGATNANTGLGFNIGTGQLALGGLSALGNLWTAWNATDLAKKNFQFNSKLAMANYGNQAQAYNTNLEDKINARYFMEGKSPSEAASYVNSHRLQTSI